MRHLLLSNSTNHGGTFLGHAEEILRAFLGREVDEVLFVPYAAVTFSFDDYTEKVAERLGVLGYGVRGIHREPDQRLAVERARAIAVGGGNTFHLLDRIYREHLLEPIRERVRSGCPYIGWSAGSNLACPTIRTTNDMPIVEPKGLEALGLVPFQINAHFTDAAIPSHGGETRSMRLEEFIAVNPGVTVIGLREGTGLHVEDDIVRLVGPHPARLFRSGREPVEVEPGEIRWE